MANGEFVVTSSHGSVPFEAIDSALDSVPLAVVGLVELRRAASAGAELLAVADLVTLLRDRAADPVSAQVSAVLP
ncbi:hypothetical protein GCM10010289_79820 [Streptomyces violascens]|nr:hypothetical protein GCM10010289_79820 [Streptomyces violascens]